MAAPPAFGLPENQLSGFKRCEMDFRGVRVVSVTTGSGTESEDVGLMAVPVVVLGVMLEEETGGAAGKVAGAETEAGGDVVAEGDVATTSRTGGDSAGSGLGVGAV